MPTARGRKLRAANGFMRPSYRGFVTAACRCRDGAARLPQRARAPYARRFDTRAAAPEVVIDPLPELIELEQVIAAGAGHVTRRVVCEAGVGARRFPVLAITLGNPDPAVPAVGFFGGVHGLERIGAHVVIAHLRHLVMRLRWDQALQRDLESLRLVFMPIVNPGGMALSTRANPNGVDLMRNAPIDADHPVPFMIGGQRQSNRLPWYRGAAGEPMQAESQAVCDVVEAELAPRPFSIAVDCHSGFGTRDRVWFPYAHTMRPIPHLADVYALRRILDDAHPHHRYVIEPQSRQYLAHGDLWDHLYLRSLDAGARTFLPLTLEMGSWLWVKKNPRQIFSRHGIFNPLIEHRRERVLRQHLGLMDFLVRAALSFRHWLPQHEQRAAWHDAALTLWYRRRAS